MDWYLWEMNRRYAERQDETRVDALARLASEGNLVHSTFTGRLLASVGGVLVDVGLRLQSRQSHVYRG